MQSWPPFAVRTKFLILRGLDTAGEQDLSSKNMSDGCLTTYHICTSRISSWMLSHPLRDSVKLEPQHHSSYIYQILTRMLNYPSALWITIGNNNSQRLAYALTCIYLPTPSICAQPITLAWDWFQKSWWVFSSQPTSHYHLQEEYSDTTLPPTPHRSHDDKGNAQWLPVPHFLSICRMTLW
jgi:hypothetical protein